MFQNILEERSLVGPEMVENDFFAPTDDDMRTSTSFYGSPLPPTTFWGLSGEQSKNSTRETPHSQSTLTPPSVIVSGLLQADSLQDSSVNPTVNRSMIMDLPPLQRSTTDGSISVAQSKTPDQLTSVQKPDPETHSPQIDLSSAESAPGQHDLPFGESDTINSTIHAKTSEDAKNAFASLVPLLHKVHYGNFCGLLLHVIKETHHQVPLRDVFCMLYSGDTLEGIHIPKGESLDMNNFSQERLIGIKTQYLVRESFRIPDTFQDGLFQDSTLPTVNFHEFLRNFLAIKILFCCVKKVNDSSQTLPRLSLFKVYYILCQKLMHEYPEFSNYSSSLHHNILGQPKIGVLTKLVYPYLKWKRLGKRGQSKVHYLGWTWNESIIDHDIIGLLDLDLAKLSEYFTNRSQVPIRRRVSRSQNSEKDQEASMRHTISKQTIPIPMPSLVKPRYSFVDLTDRYPDWHCSPRIWNVTPNTIPTQSLWVKVTMERSVEVLKRHGVNLDPLIANMFKVVFSGEDQYIISDTLMHSIMVLFDGTSPKETFLHLYLVVLLLLFPVIIASDQEVSIFAKLQLRASVKHCVTKLEDKFSCMSCIDMPSLTTFINILRKMIHISEMTSSKLELSHSKAVFKEVGHDIKHSTITVSECGDISKCEELFIKGAINALNAYSNELISNRTTANEIANVTNIHNIGKAFQQVTLEAIHTMVSITSGLRDAELFNDVPYQVFRISVKLFHEVTLSFPEILQLPIPIITFIILHYLNEMQKASFGEFVRRGPDLAKETFKCWWIFSSMLQEYMCVISEVVALTQTLA
ncbi:hypothetical protein JCM33374_g1984 [Metschnikowia sp. JCM 33374]|nr:hypothetical protein JCM33374_g1984 [Metschnikowia sp. JCM 33374]